MSQSVYDGVGEPFFNMAAIQVMVLLQVAENHVCTGRLAGHEGK